MKVLIISVNALGDTYLSCAALKSLREKYNDPIIDFVANSNAKLFLDKFHLNRIFYLNKKSIIEVIKTFFLLREEKYDIVYNFFPGRVNSFFSLCSNSKIKSGFVNLRKLNEWHNSSQKLFLKGINISSGKQAWNPEMNYLKRITMCLNSTGVNVNDIDKPHIHLLSPSLRNNTNDVVIHFTSNRFDRNIKNSELVKLVTELINEMNLKVSLIGAKRDFVKIGKLRTHKNIQFISEPSIEMLISILTDTKLFIGVDSFPIHLADAYGVKTIGIFGDTNPKIVFQSMKNKFIVKKRAVKYIRSKDILEVFESAFYKK